MDDQRTLSPLLTVFGATGTRTAQLQVNALRSIAMRTRAVVFVCAGISSLGAGTGPLGPVCQLARIRSDALAYVETLRVPGAPFGAYREPASEQPSLYASCDVAIMRVVWGEDLRITITDEQRREWIAHINSFAEPDGTYSGRLGRHSVEHANGMVIGALGTLGGRQKYPVRLYDQFDTVEEVGPWLEQIDWQRQWSGSHLFWGGMHCYSMTRRCTEAWLTRVFDWLDANLDPETGWWRKGTPPSRPFDPLGGGAHIWPIYQHHGRRFPFPEKVIDSILAAQKPDGSWLSCGSYMDLDALYGLAYMRSLAPGHRSADILAAVARHGRELQRVWPALLVRQPDLHRVLAAVGGFGLLQQLMPDAYVDSVRWTDIFTDLRLYQTQAVAADAVGVSANDKSPRPSIAPPAGVERAAWSGDQRAANGRRPNVILIMTDDQGYADFGVHGNPY